MYDLRICQTIFRFGEFFWIFENMFSYRSPKMLLFYTKLETVKILEYRAGNDAPINLCDAMSLLRQPYGKQNKNVTFVSFEGYLNKRQ